MPTPRTPLSAAAADGSAAAAAASTSAAADDDESPRATAPASSLTVESELNHIAFGRFQTMALLVLGLANASDAVELLCLSFILPVIDGGYSAQDKALLSAGIFCGMLVGGLVFGAAADRYGRRVTLCVSLAINAFFGLLSAVTPSFGVLLTCRVLAGFGVGGSIPGVFTLAAELLPTLDRGFWLSTVAWWWMVGAIYTAGLAWALLGSGASWQAFAAACARPAGAAAALVLLLLPESPRYLHTSARNAEGARAAPVKQAQIEAANPWLQENLHQLP
jgi:VNT family MFS transporter (synaptic vesicle glycoprotein 2)